MNGRIYDPGIGRFLSADPHVTSPNWLQSFNRYAYVLNNPLALTDPSGFDWDDCGVDTCANLRRSAGLPPLFATDRSAHWDLALPLQWNRFAPMPLPGYYPAQHENGEIVQLPYLRPVATQNNSLPPVTVISSSDNSGVMDNYLTREQQLWAEPGLDSFHPEKYLIPLTRVFRSLLVAASMTKNAPNATHSGKDFFANTKYTNKVLGQMKQNDFHAFPESVKALQDAGHLSKITGRDGVTREMLKIPGRYRGKEGAFEFIKEADGSINHRLFKPNGR